MLEKLKSLIEVREQQVFAFNCFYADKLSNKDLQSAIDEYSLNLATDFIKKHKEDLNNSEIKTNLMRYLSSVGANKPYSGYRFYETLYKQLKSIKETPQIQKQ